MGFTFRWSIWGPAVTHDVEMLRDSISSVYRVMPVSFDAVVYTDSVMEVKRIVGNLASIRDYNVQAGFAFREMGPATWTKWCPSPRLAPGTVEVVMDTDVFFLRPPLEILRMEHSDCPYSVAAMGEPLGAPWQRGVFTSLVPTYMPYINAGLVVQGPEEDLTERLWAEYQWWKRKARGTAETFHDEQGALTRVLAAPGLFRKLLVLPVNRYAVVSPRSNSTLADASHLVALHATHPDHPAYYRFRAVIRGGL